MSRGERVGRQESTKGRRRVNLSLVKTGPSTRLGDAFTRWKTTSCVEGVATAGIRTDGARWTPCCTRSRAPGSRFSPALSSLCSRTCVLFCYQLANDAFYSVENIKVFYRTVRNTGIEYAAGARRSWTLPALTARLTLLSKAIASGSDDASIGDFEACLARLKPHEGERHFDTLQ